MRITGLNSYCEQNHAILEGNKRLKDDKINPEIRVYQKVIYKGDKKVGDVQPKDDDETTLVFTNYAEFKGKAVLRKVKRMPPVWKGTLTKDDGTEWQMDVEVKDR